MNNEQMLGEIRDANLTYLMLAQRLIREDRAQALYRLGLSEEAADVVERLSAGQMLKIAGTNVLMCAFRYSDQVVWNLLAGHAEDRQAAGVHAAILMAASRPAAAHI